MSEMTHEQINEFIERLCEEAETGELVLSEQDIQNGAAAISALRAHSEKLELERDHLKAAIKDSIEASALRVKERADYGDWLRNWAQGLLSEHWNRTQEVHRLREALDCIPITAMLACGPPFTLRLSQATVEKMAAALSDTAPSEEDKR